MTIGLKDLLIKIMMRFVKLGYPKADDFDKIIIVPYRGFEIQKIKHELFGDKEVEVYAIRAGNKL